MGTPEISVVPATAEHLRQVAQTMRSPDAAEVLASNGQTPLEALEESVALTDVDGAKALLADGQPMAIFGCVDLGHIQAGMCGMWCLTSELVEKNKIAFQKATNDAFAAAFKRYEMVTNVVDCRYTRAIKWLTRMGAGWAEPKPIGEGGHLFQQFVLDRAHFREV